MRLPVAGEAIAIPEANRRSPLDVVLLGTGNVGGELLRLLQESKVPPLRLLGVANSRHMLFDVAGIRPESIHERLCTGSSATNIDTLVNTLLEHCVIAPVVIDATASESVAQRHAGWLDDGIHVITANKLALANGWLHGRGKSRCGHYGDAATVGAGLPVLTTIRRLRAAGDAIIRVEGILSGSLSYLMHGLQQGHSFSASVHKAMQLGLAEPDPRQDLAGSDVIRKLCIIADAAGVKEKHRNAEPLLPASEQAVPLEAFLRTLTHHDAEWRARSLAADDRGCVLRHVASLDADGNADIRVREVPREDPLAQTRNADNCVSIYSRAYANEPLVIRGPGAGATVTATALLADVAGVYEQHAKRPPS